MYLKERNGKVKERLKQFDLDAALVTSPENIYYLSGLSDTEGIFLLHEEDTVFFTDFRYLDAIREQKPFFEVMEYKQRVKDIANWIERQGFKRIGFESASMSFSSFEQWKGVLTGMDLVPCSDLIEKIRLIKDKMELGLIRESIKILAKAMDSVPEMLRHMTAPITEREISIELEYMMKKAGAQRAAFDIIVATGKRSAFPHYTPSDCHLEEGDVLLVDCGAVYKGYHSDMTRVMVVGGNADREVKKIYTIVREAQKAAASKVHPGAVARDIDDAARGVIKEAGYGDRFGHSTGHGVGLMVHEDPKINQRSETELYSGMVFTIEPGIYLENQFGVRWEDMFLVTDDGCQNLTQINWDTIDPI